METTQTQNTTNATLTQTYKRTAATFPRGTRVLVVELDNGEAYCTTVQDGTPWRLTVELQDLTFDQDR